MRSRCDAVLRVAAAVSQRADPVTLGPADDSRTRGRDHAGYFEARNVAVRWRRTAPPLVAVMSIDACGMNCDKEFVICRRWHGDAPPLENVRSTRRSDEHCVLEHFGDAGHANSPLRCRVDGTVRSSRWISARSSVVAAT